MYKRSYELSRLMGDFTIQWRTFAVLFNPHRRLKQLCFKISDFPTKKKGKIRDWPILFLKTNSHFVLKKKVMIFPVWPSLSQNTMLACEKCFQVSDLGQNFKASTLMIDWNSVKNLGLRFPKSLVYMLKVGFSTILSMIQFSIHQTRYFPSTPIQQMHNNLLCYHIREIQIIPSEYPSAT